MKSAINEGLLYSIEFLHNLECKGALILQTGILFLQKFPEHSGGLGNVKELASRSRDYLLTFL